MKTHRFQFMPFGAGPRICIGAAFAMIEATIMLATFVRAGHFEVSPDFDPQPSARMFLLPERRHANAGHIARELRVEIYCCKDRREKRGPEYEVDETARFRSAA